PEQGLQAIVGPAGVLPDPAVVFPHLGQQALQQDPLSIPQELVERLDILPGLAHLVLQSAEAVAVEIQDRHLAVEPAPGGILRELLEIAGEAHLLQALGSLVQLPAGLLAVELLFHPASIPGAGSDRRADLPRLAAFAWQESLLCPGPNAVDRARH